MRSKKPEIREVPPDRLYGDPDVTKFINMLMWDGKKTIAERIFYNALKIVEERTGKRGYEVWKEAVENVKPLMEVKPYRVGGATLQVPVEVPPRRKRFLAFKWIIEAARNRKGKPMEVKLAEEIISAHKKEGEAYKKKIDTHKMAEANKAFAHYKL